MLFLGNSYTFMGPLDDAVEAVFAAAGEDIQAERLAEPGWRFTQHVAEIETEGTAWEAAFETPQSWVMLQEQSQIPGFAAGQTDLVSSQDAAVVLDGYAASAGAQTMFVMTWGRRAGDEQNPEMWPDYPSMQTALTAGYLEYVSRASADGTAAWVAPAGLAWARVHDDVVADGIDPLDPSSAFFGLYVDDGSHPSPRGTYLTACVIYASVTGETPVGLDAPDSVPDAAYLQGVAAAVVLQGKGITYPWQVDAGGPDDTDGTDDTDVPNEQPQGEDPGGCGCDVADAGLGAWVAGLGLLLVVRRRGGAQG